MNPSYLIIALLANFLHSCSNTATIGLRTADFPISAVSTESYEEGDQIGDEKYPPFQRLAGCDMTIISGRWTDGGMTKYGKTGTYYGAQKSRWWSVEVNYEASKESRVAVTTATNGYDSKLGWAINSSLRIAPRFERKSFTWGQAVSFFAQYQNCNTNYVPNNGMLTYEVHGITNSGMYVRARFGVTHPELDEFGSGVRDYRDYDPANLSSPMRRDPDYRLVETVSASSFEPSLDEIDKFLDTLNIINR